MTRAEMEETYCIGRRIEAEERCMDAASLIFTSTQQEVEAQWGLYQGFDPELARVLRTRRSLGRHMPAMVVSPPGLDFSNLRHAKIPDDPVIEEFERQRAVLAQREFDPLPGSSPMLAFLPSSPMNIMARRRCSPSPSAASLYTTPTSPGSPEGAKGVFRLGVSPILSPAFDAGLMADAAHGIIPNGPKMWQEVARFLRNPLKPAILAMSRPDHKKNITTLIKAFGENPVLRELANLVLIMGNRDNIDSMAGSSRQVLTQALKLVDAYDLYGSVAYPKHHCQDDISDIYAFAARTRGVFVNIALQVRAFFLWSFLLLVPFFEFV
jgi:sucrose-phosphate synthase